MVPKEIGFIQSETACGDMRVHGVTFSMLACHGKGW